MVWDAQQPCVVWALGGGKSCRIYFDKTLEGITPP